MAEDIRYTPLHSFHIATGAQMAPFAGFEMPIRYQQISVEHGRVREAVGLFDVSHMGELRLLGPGAIDQANRLFTNDARRGLPTDDQPGRALYGAVLQDDGGILDDVMCYPISEEDVLFCVNASNVEKIYAWFADHVEAPVQLVNESPDYGQIAVQGPNAMELLGRVLDNIPDPMKPMRFATVQFQGNELFLATTGYTGERGGEVFAPAGLTRTLWDALLEHGADLGVAPIGLGARDTLRLEKGFCLYGNDINESTNPIEAGLSWTIRFDKGDFIGREALVAIKERGHARRRVGILMDERGIPRHDYPVQTEHGSGIITSGTMSPLTKQAIAMAYVPVSVEDGDVVEVSIHGRARKGRVAPMPFV